MQIQSPKLPVACPSCQSSLRVSQLSCPECSTQVSGNYPLPVLLRLPADDQAFILQFFLSGGSLKEIASQIGISYPTVRNKLDDIIEKVKQLSAEE
ncbi:Sigma-70, region 4 [compost metagenome]